MGFVLVDFFCFLMSIDNLLFVLYVGLCCWLGYVMVKGGGIWYF